MDRQLERCCGLDVHKETIAACVRIGGPERPRHAARADLRHHGGATWSCLRDWLAAHGVTHVAMESTGVYWKPVFNALESDFTCLLVNAAHIKQVPGRKTDVQDCEWIAQLLEHGLLRGSFVPPAPIRELRDLTRYRKALIQERTRVANRLHKALEDAGIKLASRGQRHPRRLGPRHAGGARPRARPIPTCWPTWRGAGCAASCRRCGRRWPAAFGRTTRSSWASCLAHLDYLDEAIGDAERRDREPSGPVCATS